MANPEQYAQVAVSLAAEKLFLYRIPPSLQNAISLGRRVLVPLGQRLVIGHVVGLTSEVPSLPLKEIQEVLEEEPFLDAHLLALTKKVAEEYLAPWGEVIKWALPPTSRGRSRWVYQLSSDQAAPSSSLTPTERKVWEALRAAFPSSLSGNQLRRRVEAADLRAALTKLQRRGLLVRHMVPVRARRADQTGSAVPSPPGPGSVGPPKEGALPPELLPLRSLIEKPAYAVFLLFGGLRRQRTHWYRSLFDLLLTSRRGALLLVPEIELASCWVEELRSLYGEQVALLHSGLSAKDRERQWRRVQEGGAPIVIGTRSAVFASHPKLGLIVLDEEQDPSYKQEEGPRYHAREVALLRAQMLKIPVLFASAIPSVESFYRAEQGEYRLLRAPEREEGGSAQIRLVDMRKESPQKGKAPLLSSPLREAMEKSLSASETVALLLNRRGYFAHLLCRECGSRLECPRCSVPLVLHRARRRLLCHSCGKEEAPPHRCPHCRGVMISYLGPGTQQVEEQVSRLFPGVAVARIDRDALPLRDKERASLSPWSRDGAKVIVGTQMILRRPEFHRASLIGVLLADNLLSLPDFRAGERLFSLLMGMIHLRREDDSPPPQILVQTYQPGHYVLQAFQAQDYLLFYRREMASRKALSLPPFVHL
ncbi:MAG: primosomal protein N', partial [candidate division NC10 bacterium]|nr:primosomal protein N' [candidate division NC10 bacterium]